MKPFDSLIFDLDGTLWDAVDLYAKAWNIFFERHKISNRVTREQLECLMGLEAKGYLEKVIPQFSQPQQAEIYNQVIEIQYLLIETEGGILYPGVSEGIERLTEYYPLFIVSNCPALSIRYFLKSNHLNTYITDSLAHGQNYQHKHENIKMICDKHHLKHPLYVGDTDSDRKQCDLANIPFAYVDYGFGFCTNYHYRFSSFSELVEFFLTQ